MVEWGLRDYEVEGQIGLEEHPNLYIVKLVEGFGILKSKLKKTGSLYLNLGDTYFGNSSYSKEGRQGFEDKDGMQNNMNKAYRSGNPDPKLLSRIRAREQFNSKIEDKDKGWLQPKQLMGIPWRVAIAMQEDGWILRNCIIWHKPNPMPTSVHDRLNTTYEFIFHFVKSRRYFYDLTPIREPHKDISINRMKYGWHGTLCKNHKMSGIKDLDQLVTCNPMGKNPGDCWEISTQSFKGAHFATFPEKLVLKPLLASCPQFICIKCGFIRERVLRPTKEYKELLDKARKEDSSWTSERRKQAMKIGNAFYNKQKEAVASYKTVGWTECSCNCEFKPGIILDPFFGSGTVGVVAIKNNRNFIGFELKQEYVKIAEDRLKPLLVQQKLVTTL